MKITYIHHSGYLVALEAVLLLFDYVGGPLPELDAARDLIIFSSHRHGDHFDPLIFELDQKHPKVRFVLSDDIWKKRVPKTLLAKTSFVKPDTSMRLSLSDESEVNIAAYKSTDEGVAFVVRTGGQTIYHAGDLNDWRWEGESDSWNNKMHADYMRELEKMLADNVKPDAAMIPVDGRLEQWFGLGLREFMDTVGAGMIFPMHFWRDFGIIARLKQQAFTQDYRDRIADIVRDGQTFVL